MMQLSAVNYSTESDMQDFLLEQSALPDGFSAGFDAAHLLGRR